MPGVPEFDVGGRSSVLAGLEELGAVVDKTGFVDELDAAVPSELGATEVSLLDDVVEDRPEDEVLLDNVEDEDESKFEDEDELNELDELDEPDTLDDMDELDELDALDDELDELDEVDDELVEVVDVLAGDGKAYTLYARALLLLLPPQGAIWLY